MKLDAESSVRSRVRRVLRERIFAVSKPRVYSLRIAHNRV